MARKKIGARNLVPWWIQVKKIDHLNTTFGGMVGI